MWHSDIKSLAVYTIHTSIHIPTQTHTSYKPRHKHTLFLEATNLAQPRMYVTHVLTVTCCQLVPYTDNQKANEKKKTLRINDSNTRNWNNHVLIGKNRVHQWKWWKLISERPAGLLVRSNASEELRHPWTLSQQQTNMTFMNRFVRKSNQKGELWASMYIVKRIMYISVLHSLKE